MLIPIEIVEIHLLNINVWQILQYLWWAGLHYCTRMGRFNSPNNVFMVFSQVGEPLIGKYKE